MDFSFIRGTPHHIKPILEEDNTQKEQAPQLTNQYKAEQKSINMYIDYQKNIKAAENLREELLKGTRAAEDGLILFLKACKCISFMTGEKLFYEQIQANIYSIYGLALQEPMPIIQEMEIVKERLNKLQEAEKRVLQIDSKARIVAAIRSHKEQLLYLQKLLNE